MAAHRIEPFPAIGPAAAPGATTATDVAEAPILIVDDNRDNVHLFELILKPLGQPTVGVYSGGEALEAVASREFAVILLDVQMPGMDGFEVAEALQGAIRNHSTAVIFITAWHCQDVNVKQGYDLGAIDYMFKPVVKEVLRAKVSVFVNLYLQRKALQTALARAVAAERQVRAQAAELERSNEELGRFAYIASHDLKEPLRMVTSYVQLLGKRYGGQLDEKADKYIRFATDGAERMRDLIDDLLQYSRVGTRARSRGAVDLGSALARVVQDLKVALQEADASIVHDRLPTVSADQRQLEQLLQNLLANAIKFRGPAPPRIQLDAQPLARLAEGAVPGLCAADLEGDGWLVSVADNGIGLDAKFAEEIFLIFKRLHGRDKFEGTGIGLAVCRKIVERHGGRIWVVSEPGEGATFHFTLPEPSPEQAEDAPYA